MAIANTLRLVSSSQSSYLTTSARPNKVVYFSGVKPAPAIVPFPPFKICLEKPAQLPPANVSLISPVPAPSIRTTATRNDPGGNQALLGPLVLSGTDLIGDFSSHIRKGFDSSNVIYGTENPVALGALGLTSGFGVIAGGLSIKDGLREAERAKKINDVAGQTMANLKIAKGGLQTATGALMVPVRGLTIASLATSSSACATVAGVLGSIAGVFSNVFVIILGVVMGIRIREQVKFRNAFQKILKDPAIPEEQRNARALEHLKQLLTVSPQERDQIREKLLSKEKNRLLNYSMLAEKIGKKENKLLQKKEALFKRVTNETCLTDVREKGVSEAKSVIESVQKSVRKNLILNSIGIALIGTGMLLGAISFIFLFPIAITASAVFGLAVSLGWVLIDIYALAQNFNSNNPGRYDKLLILISSLVAVVAIAAVFFFTGGLVPLIAAIVVGTVWLTINAVCYYRLYQVEKKKSESATS